MGFFKQMKDLKQMTEAAPDMIRQAQQMGAQAQQMQSAQQHAAAANMQAANAAMYGDPAAEAGPDFEPIGGVSLQLYADISKGLAAYGYDQSKAVEVAASKGVSGESWEQASTGWPARIKANRAVGQRFNAYYTAG
jgi:hypothetical protein